MTSITATPAGYEQGKVSPLGDDYSTGPSVNLDVLSAVASYVRKGWGEYGYSVQLVAAYGAFGAVARVSHFDGSRFDVKADRYGNVEYVGEVR